jgi:hypothetical protein
MRMPGIVASPLPEHLEEIRQVVAALPDVERRQVMHRINADNIRRNDDRHGEIANRVDRERRRPRPDPRQMRLDGAA